MTRLPGSRLAPLILLALPALVFARWVPLLAALVLVYDVGILMAWWLDGRRLRGLFPTAERLHEARIVLGAPNKIRIRLHNPSRSYLFVEVADDPPSEFRAEPSTLAVEIPPFGRREVEYRVNPERRGAFRFGAIHLRIQSRARLARAQTSIAAGEDVRVYPNVLGPRRYELAARRGDLSAFGIHNVRRDGGGGEFEKLREYVSGDDYGDVDWKATAKREKPITRVFQRERSQQVLLCIDAGRMMATRVGTLTKLDHALDAALLTSWVALRQGDKVGLLIFDSEVRTFVPPRGGLGQYRKILEALSPIEPVLTFVDFRRFADFVRLRVKRRTLLVLFSDLLDETHALPLVRHAPVLSGKHLSLCVTLRDETVVSWAERPPTSTDEAFGRVAAIDLLAEQAAIKAGLKKRGISVLETRVGTLATSVINHYLKLKHRGAL